MAVRHASFKVTSLKTVALQLKHPWTSDPLSQPAPFIAQVVHGAMLQQQPPRGALATAVLLGWAALVLACACSALAWISLLLQGLKGHAHQGTLTAGNGPSGQSVRSLGFRAQSRAHQMDLRLLQPPSAWEAKPLSTEPLSHCLLSH
jgi:hypothetical protein